MPTPLAAELLDAADLAERWLAQATHPRSARAGARWPPIRTCAREKAERDHARRAARRSLRGTATSAQQRCAAFATREYLRLGARELGFGTPAEVGRELAAPGRRLPRRARWRTCSPSCAARTASRAPSDGRRCRFVVIGMGKLGGEELNFSSDVDLIYLYETDAGAAGELSRCTSSSRAVAERLDRAHRRRHRRRLRASASICGCGPRARAARSPTRSPPPSATTSRGAGRGSGRRGSRRAPSPAIATSATRRWRCCEPFVWPRSTGAATSIERGARADGARSAPSWRGARRRQARPGRHPRDRVLRAGAAAGARRRATAAARARHAARARQAAVRRPRHRARAARARRGLRVPAPRRAPPAARRACGRRTRCPDDPDRRALLARRLGFADRAAFERELARVRAARRARSTPRWARPTAAARRRDPAPARSGDARASAGRARWPRSASPTSTPRADEMRAAARKPQLAVRRRAGRAARAGPAARGGRARRPIPTWRCAGWSIWSARRGAAAAIWRLIEPHRAAGAPAHARSSAPASSSRKELIAQPELVEPLLSARQAQPRCAPRAELDARPRARAGARSPPTTKRRG